MIATSIDVDAYRARLTLTETGGTCTDVVTCVLPIEWFTMPERAAAILREVAFALALIQGASVTVTSIDASGVCVSSVDGIEVGMMVQVRRGALIVGDYLVLGVDAPMLRLTLDGGMAFPLGLIETGDLLVLP